MKFIFLLASLFHDVGLGTKSLRQVSHLIGDNGVSGLGRGAFCDPCLLPKDFRCLAHFPSTTAGDRGSIGEIALAIMFVFCSSWSIFRESGASKVDLMDTEKQRELIRLWNRMRRVEGPVAEEIRIQILEVFAERDRTKRAA
jgi:hypothetical protein